MSPDWKFPIGMVWGDIDLDTHDDRWHQTWMYYLYCVMILGVRNEKKLTTFVV